MTRAYDIKQLIAEESSATAERRALEEMADRLEDTLSADVPYRPEFKAQLRKRLMAQAHQQLTPWYRRPAFFGSGLAVAAAAAVLVVGINLWQNDEIREVQPPSPGIEESDSTPTAPPDTPPNVVTLVTLPTDLRQIQLADEKVTPASPAPNFEGNAEVAQGLQLKRLTARPDEEQFRNMANRLAFRGESRRTTTGWLVSEGSRTLNLTADGQVGYADTAPAAAETPAISTEGARDAAFRFLDQALLPVPGQPVVTRSENGFQVVYTEQVDGRPVINARTVIAVNEKGAVVQAEAYVASGTTTHSTHVAALTEAEAVAEAKARGGNFDRADLVWVRTPGDGPTYLQPYWRVFGTDSQGTAMVRYVPALKR